MKLRGPLFSTENLAGLSFVVAVHGAALWELWQHRLIPAPQEALTLFVDFITAPVPERAPPPPPPKPQRIEKPQPRQIVAAAPVVAPAEHVAPPPPPEPSPPAIQAPAAPPAPPRAIGPVILEGDLAPTCSVRSAPAYPSTSRRLGEEGKVVLRIELDEGGGVAAARVARSSGFERLDTAALEAVRGWRCHPARRDGQPVRAVALQPFNFVLQGS